MTDQHRRPGAIWLEEAADTREGSETFVDGEPKYPVATYDDALEVMRRVSAGPKPVKPDHWPSHIEARVTSAGNWGWFDTSVDPAKRTYPSWVEDRLIREIYLYDEDLSGEHPTGKMRNLAGDLKIYLGTGRVMHKDILEKIMEIEGVLKKYARGTLVEMWQAGLVRRYGKYYNGRRLCNQEWEIV